MARRSLPGRLGQGVGFDDRVVADLFAALLWVEDVYLGPNGAQNPAQTSLVTTRTADAMFYGARIA